MKNGIMTLAVLSMTATLFFTVEPVIAYSGGGTTLQIKRRAADLDYVEKQIRKGRLEIAKGREKLEKDVLSQVDRSSARSLVAKFRALNRNYRNDGWDDISFLQDHWKGLTPEQKDLVVQDRYEFQ